MMKTFVLSLLLAWLSVGMVAQTVTVGTGSCTLDATTHQCTVSLNVTANTPVNPIGVSIAPASSTLQIGQSQTFVATVANSISGVTWKLTGAVGTVDTNGLFTATALGTGTVVATSVQDTTKSASAFVTITSPTPPPPPPPNPTGFDGPAELPRVYLTTSKASQPTPGKTTLVPAGGLQAALNAAACGDTLLLTGSYPGTFTFPAKPCDDGHWIQIRTANNDSALPAEGTRILPCYGGVASLPGRSFTCTNTNNVMAQLIVPVGNTSGPILFGNGANHYRIGPGIIIAKTPGTAIIYALASALGTADKITFDRVWLKGAPQDETKTMISLNGMTNTAVIDSYSSDAICVSVVGICTDSKVIGGGTSTLPGGPYKITNNFLEASGENILLGGGSATTTPADIEIRGNHFFKPLIWLNGQPGFVGAPGGQAFMVKNLLEMKNAQRILIEGNIFEYSWGGYSQPGYAILIAPKNQASGCPICLVTDYTFRFNTIAHTGGGFQIESVPDDNGAIGKDGQRYSIHDVTVTDINKTLYAGVPGSSNGVLFQVISGWPNTGQIQHVWINHITGFPDPTGKIFAIGNNPTYPEMTDLKVQNSIFGQALYPVWSTGGTNNCANPLLQPLAILNNCFNPYQWADDAMIAVSNQYPPQAWPTTSFFPASITAVGFTSTTDLTLLPTSPYYKKGTDGKDLGADIAAINAATAGAR